jgi:hypothetical protein
VVADEEGVTEGAKTGYADVCARACSELVGNADSCGIRSCVFAVKDDDCTSVNKGLENKVDVDICVEFGKLCRIDVVAGMVLGEVETGALRAGDDVAGALATGDV